MFLKVVKNIIANLQFLFVSSSNMIFSENVKSKLFYIKKVFITLPYKHRFLERECSVLIDFRVLFLQNQGAYCAFRFESNQLSNGIQNIILFA